ncbi:MAG TPA: DUF3473 domain-containing protein [Acidimicrobiia bacterium]|nr:DUF3473 domain-containing protein [Acidimicrobiia bacterium]
MAVRAPITFTLDVEDHREHRHEEPRHVAATYAVLEFLAERGICGTFFVVGDVIEHEPTLVRAIAEGGHEVGVHAPRHRPLTLEARASFTDAMRATTARAQDLAQQPISGFRAPQFSLVSSTRWVTDVLADLGYRYSSSVLPIRHPLFGDPSAPRVPFRWPSGLVELPCPVAGVASRGLPFLAAVWLRNLPWIATRTLLAAHGKAPMLWSYGHPYDFDPDEPFRVLPEAGGLGSSIIWRGRDRMFDRFDRLFAGRVAPPLGERLSSLHASQLAA